MLALLPLYSLASASGWQRATSQRSDVVILMSDTHKPLPLPNKASALHFTALSATVNAYYACKHGYDFLFVRLSEPGCAHPRFGRRHPSYCKLPAVAAALNRWLIVAFVDSDSWFVPGVARPSTHLLAAAAQPRRHRYISHGTGRTRMVRIAA